MTGSLPVVGIVSSRTMDDGVAYEKIRVRYVEAVTGHMGAVPVIVANVCNAVVLLDRLDGLLLSGSVSDIDPLRYDGAPARPDMIRDPARDDMVFTLIRAAVDRALPVFGICRGFQEMNVAFGGSLIQEITDRPGMMVHHEDLRLPRDEQYLPVHGVTLAEDGLLRSLLGTTRIEVNSLHHQGVDRLAPALAVEGTAPDGLIEAARVRDAPGFALGVQWHPEWHAATDLISQALFRFFGEACKAYFVNRR